MTDPLKFIEIMYITGERVSVIIEIAKIKRNIWYSFFPFLFQKKIDKLEALRDKLYEEGLSLIE